MKFGEYRREEIGWNSKVHLIIIEGKNLRKESYDGADFEEDETYMIDDYEIIEQKVNTAFDIHWMTIKK